MIMRYRKVVDDHNICDTQKCIEVVDPSYCQFVLDAFKNKVKIIEPHSSFVALVHSRTRLKRNACFSIAIKKMFLDL